MKAEELKNTLRKSAHWICPEDGDIVQLNVNKALDAIRVEQEQQLKAFCKYCESRQIKPKRFDFDEIIKDFMEQNVR